MASFCDEVMLDFKFANTDGQGNSVPIASKWKKINEIQISRSRKLDVFDWLKFKFLYVKLPNCVSANGGTIPWLTQGLTT